MSFGIKVKEYRTKNGLTQKELAEQLHVTYQAVSRWENEDVQPSFDTLKQLCAIFGCSTDDLLESNASTNETGAKTESQKADKTSDESGGRADGTTQYGRNSTVNGVNSASYETPVRDVKKYDSGLKRRVHSFIWAGLVALLFVAVAVSSFAEGDIETGIGGLILALLGYCFTANMILNNTFIPEMWLSISSWGFVRFPGIIFTFDLDGFIFLFAMKALFFVLGILLGIIAAVFATIVAVLLSVFVYPFALYRSFKYGEEATN